MTVSEILEDRFSRVAAHFTFKKVNNKDTDQTEHMCRLICVLILNYLGYTYCIVMIKD